MVLGSMSRFICLICQQYKHHILTLKKKFFWGGEGGPSGLSLGSNLNRHLKLFQSFVNRDFEIK